MHPVIRILNLLVVAGLAPWLPGWMLFAAGIPLLAAGVLSPAVAQRLLRSLRRIRWLLLSLAVLFLWFTPGTPVFETLGSFSPTWSGVAAAAQRAGVLVIMVWAATVLVGGLQPGEVAAALRRLLAGPLHAPVTVRFAERVGLLLAELPVVETRVYGALQRADIALADRAARLFVDIEQDAGRLAFEPVAPLRLGAVPALQWLLPNLLLVAGILSIGLQV